MTYYIVLYDDEIDSYQYIEDNMDSLECIDKISSHYKQLYDFTFSVNSSYTNYNTKIQIHQTNEPRYYWLYIANCDLGPIFPDILYHFKYTSSFDAIDVKLIYISFLCARMKSCIYMIKYI